jgi:hypothetical protein
MKQVSDQTGEYLHNLHKHQPDKDTLQKMIDNVPSSLSYIGEYRSFPIFNAVMSKDSVGYVPLLAKEEVKHKVDRDHCSRGGQRGGLLLEFRNVLYKLVTKTDGDTSDAVYLNAMKELIESNLLRKKDIKEHDLLYNSTRCPGTSMRFDFLADWYPEGLKAITSFGLPLIHAVIQYSDVRCFPVFLKASLKHYPNELGLLFQKDTSEGQIACKRAFNHKLHGKEKTLKAIGKLIPFDDPKLPILHHFAKHAPQYMEDFAC